MAEQPFRYRTIVEVAVISVLIYVLLGAPGLSPKTSDLISGSAQIPSQATAKIESIVYPSRDLECRRHDTSVQIFSTSPLVIYIDGFVSDAEIEHLISLSEEKWQVSTVFNEGRETTDDAIRKSEKALIERDKVVQCVEQRALAIQGWPQETFIERLWTQRYNVSGHYSLHYDWATANKQSRRVSTFMVYLKADCVGGGTQFPRLVKPRESKWCEFMECDGDDEGVTFKARRGAAVFWRNFDEDGRGYKETIHAGMPVTEGQKIGLNIWSWYQAGHKAPGEVYI